MRVPLLMDRRSKKRLGLPTLQRCGGHPCIPGTCDHEGPAPRSEGAGRRTAPNIVHEALRSPGQPLDRVTLSFMQPRFSHDFSHVRVHTDAPAAKAAAAVNALAYTVGSHVVFGAQQYRPQTQPGRMLIAHELTHVVQQADTGATAETPIVGSIKGDAAEQEADAAADSIGREAVPVAPSAHRQHSIQLQGAGAGAAGGAAPPAAPAEHRFTAQGVSVVVRHSCSFAQFGFGTVEAGTRAALNAIFDTDCIEESRRLRIQRNLTAHGLDIRCRRSLNLETPGACAESTGFFIPANIFTVGSRSFPAHPDALAGCQPLESTMLHEIVHLTRGFAQESLPGACEASCFGVGGGNAVLCRDIDVFGRRVRGGT